MRKVRIGAGAGYSGDRIEPAVELIEHGNLDYLVFECLAERTIALAQTEKRNDPNKGYDPLLVERMSASIAGCRRHKTRIVTNMGAANPLAAARRTQDLARSLGVTGLKIAAVVGDDLLPVLAAGQELLLDNGETTKTLGRRLISANAYLGGRTIALALAAGADIVVTGRTADPALFLGPLVHEFGWADDDWQKLGQGTLAGHLLECAGQVTGGYFADPGRKDVPNLHLLGFPIGEIGEDGSVVITKVPGTGGKVCAAVVKEQLLYEIHDPSKYLQPDVVADFQNVIVDEVGPDCVHVTGGSGKQKSGKLKVSVGYLDSFIGEGQISYAGPGAVERATLACDIVRKRLDLIGLKITETRFDLIGINSVHGSRLSDGAAPYEARVRVAGRVETAQEAVRIGNEVEALYTNGPAGGGGAWKSVREVVAVASGFIDGSAVTPSFTMFES